MSDYGPVPVSRLKEESQRVFGALEAGRRVMVSRYGEVVAVLDPPDVQRDAPFLAAYAVGAGFAFGELTATELGQGSPSEYVRRAEIGDPSYLTRGGKVLGVLRRYDAGADPDDSALVDQREAYLAEFEQEHPDATPEEFAAAAAAFEPPTSIPPFGADSHGRLLAHALLIKGQALEATGQDEPAEVTFRELIEQFEDSSDGQVTSNVNEALVQLADLYARNSQPVRALGLVDTALFRMGNGVARPDRVIAAGELSADADG